MIMKTTLKLIRIKFRTAHYYFKGCPPAIFNPEFVILEVLIVALLVIKTVQALVIN